MNTIKMIRSATCALIVLASMNVYAQASRSDAIAAAAPTVKTTKAADRALGKKVRAALTRTKGLDAAHITVLARGAAVVLAGTVADALQADLAATAASGVAGVASVDNRLSIKQKGQ